MNRLQLGLDMLTEKYGVDAGGKIAQDGSALTIDGHTYPLLPWENERRMVELKKIFAERLGNICTYRIEHIAPRGTDLNKLLLREVGVMEFTLGSKAKEIFSIASKDSMNCIVEAENGCVCTIELAATLAEHEEEIDKHEMITDNGEACDMVVDTQVPQRSIYVLGQSPASFCDTDAELFGYSQWEITTIRTAFALAKEPALREAAARQYAHLQDVLNASARSLAGLCNEEV